MFLPPKDYPIYNIFYSIYIFHLQEVKFFTYENSAKHKIERDAIAEVETRGCYAQQKQAYTVNILVPPTPPTDCATSKIVHVKYHLRVSMNSPFNTCFGRPSYNKIDWL